MIRWYSYDIYEANLLDFSLVCLLGQVLNFKMVLEERKLSLSAYKTAMKRRTQIVMIMMGWGSFTLGGFIVPEGIMGSGGDRSLKVARWEERVRINVQHNRMMRTLFRGFGGNALCVLWVGVKLKHSMLWLWINYANGYWRLRNDLKG